MDNLVYRELERFLKPPILSSAPEVGSYNQGGLHAALKDVKCICDALERIANKCHEG
jgi:hypothetical protein